MRFELTTFTLARVGLDCVYLAYTKIYSEHLSQSAEIGDEGVFLRKRLHQMVLQNGHPLVKLQVQSFHSGHRYERALALVSLNGRG